MTYYVVFEAMTADISLITDQSITMYVWDGDPYYVIRKELHRINPRAKLLSYEPDVMDDFRGY